MAGVLSSAVLVLAAVGVASREPSSFPSASASFPVFRGVYGSNMTEHYRFGYEVGVQFSASIKARVDAMGQQAVDGPPADWIARHVAAYPLYAEEIRGMAAGSGATLEALFAVNLAEELSGLSSSPPSSNTSSKADHCSDAVVPSVGVVAHNEDGSATDFGHMFIAEVEIDGRAFGAFVYAGELCSGAFGWTPTLGFTLNYVRPSNFDTDNGVGRAFVSRSLLAATTFDEAMSLMTETPMIAGHNYQLVFWPGSSSMGGDDAASRGNAAVQQRDNKGAPSFYNVEAAAFFEGAVTGPLTSFFFHANEYDALDVDQVVGESTLRRTVRATKQWHPAPATADDALLLLNDTQDVDGTGAYPIYRADATLATALFDAYNASVSIFAGPPANRVLAYRATVPAV